MTWPDPAGMAALGFIDWGWIGRNYSSVIDQSVEHLYLTAVPMLFGIVIALPLALIAVHWPRMYGPLLGAAGVLFTIPSLALFGVMVPVTGLSALTAIVPLTIYTLMVLLRNMVEGLRSVDPDVLEAAEAMGYQRPRRLLTVELPLALPIMFAGVRIATVTTVGLVTISVMVGQGGLGQLIYDGMQRQFLTPLLVGIIVTIVLAVAADLLLLALQRIATPWTRKAA